MERRIRLGKYVVKRPLGKGGMATVYLAWDTKLERHVAIKVLHPLISDSSKGLQRFQREAKAAARLRHPGIIEVYDFSAGDGETPPYLVYEFIDGPNLASFLAKHGPPLPETTSLVGWALADALAAAHQAGIVHRDIKPENVLVSPDGRLVLTDFGIARLAGDETVTATGAVLGSPAYMSPEQAKGSRVDERSDIFSLGVLLYHVVTGRLPFSGPTPVAVLSAVTACRYEPPGAVRRDLGPDMDRIIRRCLQPDPEARYQSAAQLAGDLLEAARQGGIQDPQAELREYLLDPESHTRRLKPIVLRRCLERAERAMDERPGLALALCDRVLALDPDNAGARQLLERRRHRALVRKALLLLVVLLATGAGAWGTELVLRRVRSHGRTSHDSASQSRLAALGSRDAGTDLAQSRSRDANEQSADGPRARGAAPDAGSLEGKQTPRALARSHRRPRTRTDSHRTRHSPGAGPASPRAGRTDLEPRQPPSTAPRVASPEGTRPSPAPREGRPSPAPPGAAVFQIRPWCDLYVDGIPRGRSPSPRAVSLSPGVHRVVCKQPGTGLTWKKVIRIAPGKRLVVRGSVLAPCRVTVPADGAVWSVDGQIHHPGSYKIPAGRHKVGVLKPGGAVVYRWITFPPGGRCRLAATPKPQCR